MQSKKEHPGAGATARGANYSQQQGNYASSGAVMAQGAFDLRERRRTYARLRKLLRGHARVMVRSKEPGEPAVLVALLDSKGGQP
jgi:hypothetical protein